VSSPTARERLQPSLFDRLEDDLGPAIDQLRETCRVLERSIDAAAMQALRTLLADERLALRPPTEAQLAPFANLTPDLRSLVETAIRLERHRRIEQQRVVVISTERLREACLHDLQCLFNETNNEAAPAGEALAGHPAARASVVNYGLPSLAGSIRTPEQFEQLARDIEHALTVFEPRIRNAHVSLDASSLIGTEATERVGYVIEGELWGYPYDERLRIRTLLDLDLGRLTVVSGPREAVA
jgi:type VI secretion system protein ImpF